MNKKLSVFVFVLAVLLSGQKAQALFSSNLPANYGNVLSEQAYQTNTLFSRSNLTLSVTPHDFDPVSGKWNYKVSYNRMPNRSGSIYIDGNVFVSNASGQGEAYTGYSLDPDSYYRIVFYSQSNNKPNDRSGGMHGVRIINRYFKILPAEQNNTDVEDSSGSASVGGGGGGGGGGGATSTNFSTLLGDANMNGEVNIGDSLVIARHAEGQITLTGQALINADVTGDGVASGIDALLVAHYAGRLISQFPKVDGSVLLLGDANTNGVTDIGDAGVVARHVVGQIKLDGRALDNADVDGDGAITSNDSTLIANFAGCLISTFPRGGAMPARNCVGTLQISTASLPNAIIGQAYSYQLQASGGTAPYAWSAPSILTPSGGIGTNCCVFGVNTNGLFNTQTGSTVPSSLTPGNYSWTIQVTDAAGHTATKVLNLTIVSGSNMTATSPNITGPASVQTGASANYFFASTDQDSSGYSGGLINYSINWGDGTTTQSPVGFPSGLSYNVWHTWTTAGSYTFSVTATPALGSPAGAIYAVTVTSPSIQPGTVTASLDPTTPASRNIAPGTANVELARVRFSASGDYMNLTRLTVGILGANPAADLTTIYLYDGSIQVSALAVDGNTANFNFSPLMITQNSNRSLSIRADMASSAKVGDTVAVSASGGYAISVASGVLTPVSGVPVNGNYMTIAQTTTQLLGDANMNGFVNVGDALKIQLHNDYCASDSQYCLTGQALINADVTGEGTINGIDSSLVSQYGNFITVFPKVDGSTLRVGDANRDGNITSADADLISAYLASPSIGILRGRALDNSDVDNDGRVTANDKTLVTNYVNGTITAFPRH